MNEKALVLGGVSYDFIAHVDDLPDPKAGNVYTSRAYEAIGGTSAGKSFNLAKLGFDVSCYAQLGEDRYGRAVENAFRSYGAKLSPIVDPAGTERHFNLMDSQGRRMSIYTHYSTFNLPSPRHDILRAIEDHEIIVCDIMPFVRPYLHDIRALGKDIWCDIHDYDGQNHYHEDFIEAADYVFFSDSHIPDPIAFMRSLIHKGKKVAVCTRGEKGALAMDYSGEIVAVDAVANSEVIDSNGAGDAFFAGFLHGYRRHAPIAACLDYGSLTAALCIQCESLAHPELSIERIENGKTGCRR